jgi:hypothetical protein
MAITLTARFLGLLVQLIAVWRVPPGDLIDVLATLWPLLVLMLV